MKKRHIATVISVLLAYFLALGLLVYAESFSPDATILSMKDALWYSVVTLTTVGYGDLSPVTAAGKLIGGVFLLLSTSLLAMLVALIMTFGQVIARVRLSFAQGRKWYIFSNLNRNTASLAQGIFAEDKTPLLIFPKDDEENNKETATLLKKQGVLFIKGSVADALSMKKSPSGCHVFFMGADGYANYRNALSLSGCGCSLYCQSDFQPRTAPQDITVFSGHEICARLYWRQKPLEKSAQNVVIMGGGSYADALLEQALQVNVFSPCQNIRYHFFARDTQFKDLHPQLARVVAVDSHKENTDSIFFYTTPWTQHTDLITQADRVLIWADSDEENLKNYNQITKYFALKGQTHLRLSYNLADVECFGQDSQLYTPRLVMRAGLNGIAQAMHQIYLDSTGAQGPAWDRLTPFTRNSNISAADHLRTKIRILLDDDTITHITGEICNLAYRKYVETKDEKADFYRRLEHNRWMRFHALHNWTYNRQRNNSLRQHPSMVPFDRLDKTTRAKDDYSWQLLEQLSRFLKDK